MRVQSVGEIAGEELVLPPWLFEGFLRHKTLSILGAERHSGKTLLMLDMMVCLEGGFPLLGCFPVPRPRRTLFIGQDAPEWDYKGIVKKLLNGHGVSHQSASLYDSGMVLNEGIHLTDPKVWNPDNGCWLSEYYYEHPFDVLMLDTELEFHRLNENDSQQMGAWGKVKKSIRDRLGVSIITSHHLAHQTDSAIARRLRGSTTIGGTVDYEIILKAVDHRSENPRRVELSCDKARGGAYDAKWPEYMKIVQTEEKVILEGANSTAGWLGKGDPGASVEAVDPTNA